MLIVKFLIATVLVQLKLISALALVFFFITYVESNKILQTKPVFIDEKIGYSTIWIRPQDTKGLSSETTLLELLFTYWQNVVFNITYNRIKHGRYFWIKNFSIKRALSALIYATLGISRLTVLFIKLLFKIKTYSALTEELLKLLNQDADTRIIYNENNIWKTNGKQLIVWNIILEKLVKNNLPEQTIKLIKEKFFSLSFNYEDIKPRDYSHYEVKFISKHEPKIQHTLIQGVTKDDNFGGLQTNFFKAQKMNNYGKECLIYKFAGIKKESTLLHQDLAQIQIISAEKKKNIANILLGAYKNGYNEALLTTEIKEAIQQISVFEEEIKHILTELGLANLEIDLADDIARCSILAILY